MPRGTLDSWRPDTSWNRTSRDFARFQDWTGKDVLEIGVGLGADHQSFAEAGARLCGIDLTERAIEHTVARFALLGLHSDVRVADAEALPYADVTTR